MAKSLFICSECGAESSKWNGQCGGCGAWNTLEESPAERHSSLPRMGNAVAKLKFREIGEISFKDEPRICTGMGELDRVLGGGLVKGSLVLISGDPGIGKSTLLLQICGSIKKNVLYVSGEESERQIKLRAERLGIKSGIKLIGTVDCEAVAETVIAEKIKPDVIIIDSIQTMRMETVTSSAGSVTQIRECTNLLMKVAKTLEIPIFIVGHVNKDGGIAGPKVLEHIVDTVLYFEGDKQFFYRILRAVKNRFGRTNEIGVFEMTESGLCEVQNPSAFMLSERTETISGISVLCTMEGSRPILAEVQALVTKTGFGTPRRTSNGFDYNRLCLILAVLEKRTGFIFSGCDVYINVVGGLKADEPAADLSVALALYSGLCDIPVPDNMYVFGEVGLGGEIRSVPHTLERIKEGARMGFKTCIVPKSALGQLEKTDGIKVVGVGSLNEMIKTVR